MAKIKFRFTIFGLSHRLYRGSEVTVGSEDPLHVFKGICSRGVKWNTFDHRQFEIKTVSILHATQMRRERGRLKVERYDTASDNSYIVEE